MLKSLQPQLQQKGYKIRYYEFSTRLEATSTLKLGKN